MASDPSSIISSVTNFLFPQSPTNEAGYSVTDEGTENASQISMTISSMIAMVDTGFATWAAYKQYEVADGYKQIAREQYDHYMEVYVPCEDKEVEEACAAALYSRSDDVSIGRSIVSSGYGWGGAVRRALSGNGRYCTGRMMSLIKDTELARASSVAAGGTFGERFEDQYEEARNDLRWARRSQALVRGRDLVARSVDFAGFAHGIFGRLGAQAAEGASGAIGYLGYAAERGGAAGGGGAIRGIRSRSDVGISSGVEVSPVRMPPRFNNGDIEVSQVRMPPRFN